MQTLSPPEAAKMVERGALLVDVREADERARMHIPGSRAAPLSALATGDLPRADMTIFHCKGGAWTQAHAVQLAAKATGDAAMLDGGIDAWIAAGLPHTVDKGQPIEIMRQVQIGAGGLVLLGTILGWFVAPAWFALAAFVGAGLVFAGISGFCGMARILAFAPWNRRVT